MNIAFIGNVSERHCASCHHLHYSVLNQMHAGRTLVHVWFLEITLVRTSVCVFVCLPPRL